MSGVQVRQKDLKARGRPYKKLFIGGLPHTITDDAFRSFFGQFGEMLEAIVLRDSEGISRGFGYVTFANPDVSDQLLLVECLELEGKKIEVKKAMSKSTMSKQPKSTPCNKKLFVGGLAHKLTHEEFEAYFSAFGEVVDCVVMTNKEDGKGRGFGFVTFESEEVCESVVAQAHVIGGKQVDCRKADGLDMKRKVKKRNASEKCVVANKLFVGGLAYSTTREQFVNYFSAFGRVVSHVLLAHKGFGFVTFQSASVAEAVLRKSIHVIAGKKVDCMLCVESAGDQQQKHEASSSSSSSSSWEPMSHGPPAYQQQQYYSPQGMGWTVDTSGVPAPQQNWVYSDQYPEGGNPIGYVMPQYHTPTSYVDIAHIQPGNVYGHAVYSPGYNVMSANGGVYSAVPPAQMSRSRSPTEYPPGAGRYYQ